MKIYEPLIKALYLYLVFKLILFVFCIFKFGPEVMWEYYDNITLHPFSVAVYVHIVIKCVESFRSKQTVSSKEWQVDD